MKITIFGIFLLIASTGVFAQTGKATGSIEGTVTLEGSGEAVRNAAVTIVEIKRTMLTGENGEYRFDGVEAGKYKVIAHLDRVADMVKTVDVGGVATTVNFVLAISGINEQVTVTASGALESANDAYQSVNTIGAVNLAEKTPLSMGEALDEQAGVARRSFGPATGRPVIRGFDGDRVLVLRDGLRVGGIASQSGDEVEPIDVLSLDRVEIVKGPATLLYGSNAIGGVVNGISANVTYQQGLSGYFTGYGGTNGGRFGGSGGLKFGFRNLMFFANGGAQKADDYSTSASTVRNSYARNGNFSGGIGWFPRKGWLIFTFDHDRRRHAIPVEPDVVDLEYLKERRNAYEVKGGLRDLGSFIEGVNFVASYNNYRALEFENETDENLIELDSTAKNKNFNYRANFNHRRIGKFSGTFGMSGFRRDYEALGAEAPAPRTKQNSFAAYTLERLDLEKIGFQFGGRIEQNGYRPAGNLPSRNFVGFSGGAGIKVPLWTGGSFVANYQHSFRAPALEELYNNGPHPGILVFDIGNPDLRSEQGDGVDMSIRQSGKRVRLDSGFYYYNIHNFVYTAFTGKTDPSSNLPVIRYSQGNSRYYGMEASIEAKLIDGLWLNARTDYVRAELTNLGKQLPRIPPLRASLGLDWRYKALSLRPQIVMAARQARVFDNETATPGYAIFDLDASYTILRGRTVHIFSFGGNNLTNRLYFDHLSFLKNIAPEAGRGARLVYIVRF